MPSHWANYAEGKRRAGRTADPADWRIARTLFVADDDKVAEVVDQILRFREPVGDFGELVYAGMDWVDPQLARRSMELMATQVMPRVNAAIAESAGTPARLATRRRILATETHGITRTRARTVLTGP